MTPQDFLRAVWPPQGVYALATPFTIPGTDTRVYAHKTFTSIDDAAAYAERIKHQTDLYFAVHTLKEAKVWNPTKTNRKTGEQGAFEVRTHANMAAARTYFFDLDVAPDRDDKYASQKDALQALAGFCAATKLPRPMVVSSGGGLHVYWKIETEIPSGEWRQYAHQLRLLARHHGLKADPARTTDIASVLRVAGTFNHKAGNKRAVTVLMDGKTVPAATFHTYIGDALTRAGITPTTLPTFIPDTSPLAGLDSNLADTFDGPPVSMKALVATCRQMQRLTRLQGNVSEPEWYHSLNLVRFVEQGSKYAHKLSAGHPEYSADATDTKLAQLEAKGIKPTSCAKLAEVCGDEHCIGCPFAGKVKNPLMAARYKDPAPAPLVQLMLGSATPATVTIPDPPHPYIRLKQGGIGLEYTTKDGETSHITIFPHDLYPVRRIADATASTEQQVWHVALPRNADKDFVLDADALYDRRKFTSAIANHGIYPASANLNHLQDYMIAYVNELQRLADADAQVSHLGWDSNHTRFTLPHGTFTEDGQCLTTHLSLGAQRATTHVRKQGELGEQVKLLRFYNHPDYLPNQFFIMAGLAAPIFYMTGHHGVIVNASGRAGASKSTSLYTAASFWGRPDLYPINGTNNGATVRGRNERVTTLANLPVCVDEITHMTAKDAIDLAMSITQPGHRIRLTQEGIERGTSGGHKATMMLSTANNSLHTLLASDNAAGTAGSMRVFEIRFHPTKVHEKYEADAYLRGLREHHGHIGDVFIRHVLQHRDAVEARVREVMKGVDIDAKIDASERFWSATIAAVVVTAEITQQLGLLAFDALALRQWAMAEQVFAMRGTVQNEYRQPKDILADYLDHISPDVLVTDKMPGATKMPNIIKHARGPLSAHYDMEQRMLWVAKTPFRNYCVRVGANPLWIIDDLHGRGWITHRTTERTLGAKTEYAKLRVTCFGLRMDHPDIQHDINTQHLVGNARIVGAIPQTGTR
jgi:hypothetical protein